MELDDERLKTLVALIALHGLMIKDTMNSKAAVDKAFKVADDFVDQMKKVKAG